MALTYKNLLKQNHEGKELTINYVGWVWEDGYTRGKNQYNCYLGNMVIPKTVADQLLGTYQHKEIIYNSIYGTSHTVYKLLRKTD